MRRVAFAPALPLARAPRAPCAARSRRAAVAVRRRIRLAGAGANPGHPRDAPRKQSQRAEDRPRLARLRVGPHNARVALAVVTFLWGSFTVVVCVQMRFFAAPASVSHIFPVSNFPLLNPFVFNLARLAVSSLMALLVLFCYPEPPSPRLVAAGAELGFWTLLVNVCVVAALARTAAPRVGFLAQLQTIIVPLASLLCIRGPAAADPSGAAPEASSAGPPSASRPELRTLPFSLLALAGSALLALEKPGALAAGIGVSTGEGLAVLSAVFGTVYVLRSQYLSRRLPPVPLTAVKTISQASCAAIQISISHSYVFRDMSVPALQSLIAGTTLPALALNIGLVLYAGVGVSFLGAVLQISAIRHVAASDAALIFAFSPVVTAVLAALLMREVLGPRSAIGAALILTACVATAVSGARERRKERLED